MSVDSLLKDATVNESLRTPVQARNQNRIFLGGNRKLGGAK